MGTPTISAALASAIVDPSAYADGQAIDAAFATLRKDAPFAVAEPAGMRPFWAVTRHADILSVERQNDLFHNGDEAATLTTIEGDQKVKAMTGGSPHLIKSLVQMDGLEHINYRRLTQPFFLPQNIRSLEGRVREIAREFVNKMVEKGDSCDFAADIALLYPLRVIMEILGVPQEDEPLMLKLTQEIFAAADPELNRDGSDAHDDSSRIAALMGTVADLTAYFDAVTKDRRASPRSDVASVIANAQIDGQPLGALEAMGYYIIVATAGHDTTSNTTAGALWALAERPDQLKTLQNDMSLMPSFLEESIRWETPVKHFMRTATADTEVAGQKIKKGDWLMLCYPSGNRDEAVFDNPYQFDLTRKPNKHVAFGYGAHVCLGQHLARLEMRILWEELLPKLKSLQLNGKAVRTKANFVCGPKHVPISYQLN
jgi:cytochrome P450